MLQTTFILNINAGDACMRSLSYSNYILDNQYKHSSSSQIFFVFIYRSFIQSKGRKKT